MLLSSLVNVTPFQAGLQVGAPVKPEEVHPGGHTGGHATAVQVRTVSPDAGQASTVPSFITPQSLVTVSGGTGAVTLLWQIARTLFGTSATSSWVPFLISLCVGGIIYLLSVNDADFHAPLRQKVIGFFIAFLNSMVLFSAALGILGTRS